MRRFILGNGLINDIEYETRLGCTSEFCGDHLENNDQDLWLGMPGVEVHIDHIRPMKSFAKGCRIELLKCCNWNNLQLLTGPQNSRKGASFTAAESAAYDKSVGGMAIAELAKKWRAEGVCSCELCVCELT